MERGISRKAFLAAAVLTACSIATEPTRAEPLGAAVQTRATEAKVYPYYVEFRVAVDGVYGHSYIAYGRLNDAGQAVTASYADIHPTGDIPSMVLGHFIPMDAATSPEKDTLGCKLASRFRRPLTAAEYDRLKSVVARIRAAGHTWSVLAYNCNDFVADVARGIGMRVPTTLSLPYDFIPKLQTMNENILRPALAAVRAPVPHGPASDRSRTAFLASYRPAVAPQRAP
jgi:hypothetical protein